MNWDNIVGPVKRIKEFNILLEEYEDNPLVLYFLKLEIEKCEFEIKINHTIASLLINPIRSYCNEYKVSIKDFPVKPNEIAELAMYINCNDFITFSDAVNKVLPELIETEETTYEVLDRLGFFEEITKDEINDSIYGVLLNNKEKTIKELDLAQQIKQTEQDLAAGKFKLLTSRNEPIISEIVYPATI